MRIRVVFSFPGRRLASIKGFIVVWATCTTCLRRHCQSVLFSIHVIGLMLMVGLATTPFVIAEKVTIRAFKYLGMVVRYRVLCSTHIFLYAIGSFAPASTAALRSRLIMEALSTLSVTPFARYVCALRYRLLISMTLLFLVKE